MKTSNSFNLLPKTPGLNIFDVAGTPKTPAMSIRELKKEKKVSKLFLNQIRKHMLLDHWKIKVYKTKKRGLLKIYCMY